MDAKEAGDDELDVADDDDAVSTSTSTIGRGGSEFLKKPTSKKAGKHDKSSLALLGFPFHIKRF